jgi:phosphoserine aminotransferase
MQGGARSQFSAIPLNLLGENKESRIAHYLVTGHWSKLAMLEAKKYGPVHTFCDFNESANLLPNAAYLHCTDNETIDGVELPTLPVSTVPLVIDASSSIMSKPIDFKDVGLVYAATQKNLGISGLTIVIVREDLIGKAHPLTPSLLDYRVMAESDSMANTPPVFCWYITGLVLKWIKAQGGVLAIEKQVHEKAKLMYDLIDSTNYYRNKVDPLFRSKINITFNLPTPELEQTFLKEAEKLGLFYLKGHKVLGGIRASLYNAMPLEGVKALVAFMKQFMQDYPN